MSEVAFTRRSSIRRKTTIYRRRALWITILDFVVIFLAIYFMNRYILNTKIIKYDGLTFKFSYSSLKEDIGFVLKLIVINKKETQQTIEFGNNGTAQFFIKKKNGELVWSEDVIPVRYKLLNKRPKPSRIKNIINLKRGDSLVFTSIYNSIKNGKLENGEYYFGCKIVVNNKTITLERPVKVKNSKE